MRAFYQVDTCGSEASVSMETSEKTRKTRRYFISAEEQEWDYGPAGVDNFTHTPLTQADRYTHTHTTIHRFLLKHTHNNTSISHETHSHTLTHAHTHTHTHTLIHTLNLSGY